jgi:hypothetical protein
MEAADLSRAEWRKSSYSGGNGNCVEVAGWRKSSYSGSNGNCVEIGDAARVVLVRDTTDREGGTLAFTADVWARFLTTLR